MDFHSYSIEKQVEVLFEKGVFVMGIRYYGYKINLYLLCDFYVEVFYNHKRDVIEKIVPWDTRNTRTKFYVDQIKLPGDLVAGSK